MRRLLLAGPAAAVAAAAAGCGGSSIPDGISQIRVCTDQALEKSACTKDERDAPIVASRFNCSVRVGNRAGKTIDWRFLLEGQEVTSYTRTIPKGRGTMVVWVVAQPEQAKWPLPGGNWSCAATLGGRRLSASFRSGGPTARVQALAVCRTSDTVETSSGTRVCARDAGGAPISDTYVTCSAGLVNARGSTVALTVLRNGLQVLHEGPIRIPKVMTSIGAALHLPAGSYLCSFALDGRRAATRSFTIG